ncbi:D-alanine--D-alanine ligase [Streptomyces sp. NPDC088915]|uniref:D-alanine--D-alanine ligase family protein n=1 Tax=Streptomyces sp. NPDC088915 TaxID=3365912 RepID=UPI0037F73027
MPTHTVPDIKTLRIGVLCGGDSPERPGSLASGEAAAKALVEEGLHADLIDCRDVPLSALPDRIDVALLGLHGLGGEDGKMQGALETIGMPYTGSGVMASALGMYKPTFKTLVAQERMDTPKWVPVEKQNTVSSILSSVRYTLGFPVFVKPSSGGGSLAAGIAHDEAQLTEMIEKALEADPYTDYLVEEYVKGISCSVGLIEVEGHVQVLPVHSAVTDREFYDYEAKHDASLRTENCPALLPDHVTDAMKYMAKRVFRTIGAHGVLRVDFLAAANSRITMLECNTLPGLSERGNLATMAKAAGIPYPTLVQHVVKTAFTKPAYLP